MKKNQKLNFISNTLEDVQQLLSAPKPLRSRLLDFVKFLAHEFNARSSGIYLLNDDYFLESYVYYDRDEGAQPQSKFRVGEGVLGYILSTGKPAMIDNLTTHPNFVYRPGATDYIYLALVGYPIVTSKGRVGVLTALTNLSKPNHILLKLRMVLYS
ncbi:Signal transduction protein containing GAF and PtsI domains [Candidatus Bealeia paramacronuclearis]|uniref:Signal transduction protein containing GAF and PtsI domains n=1 Tax=Candidatus Bealeia paramacronuclearis TaxID=1921001 RepID=A0ABZ2C2W2_9PROT|nr:Signal transduction protein containing GAF and PtsI domains [Candidatus Bealeia paramacronuclearis]